MHDEHFAARIGHGAHKVAHKVVTLYLVDADAVLHRHRQAHRIAHGFDAIGHGARLGHQAGTKSAALHPVAGAAAVEVDLVVAPLLPQACAQRQIGRVAATELQCHRVFFGVKAQMALHTAVRQRPRGHHFGVQPGAARQQAVKKTAMAVSPIEHRRHTGAPALGRQR